MNPSLLLTPPAEGVFTAMTLNDTIIVAIVGAVVSILTTVLATVMQSFKWRQGEGESVRASAASTISEAAESMVATLRKELETQRAEQKIENEELRAEIEALRAENVQLKAKRDKELRDLVTQLNEVRQNSSDLRDWAERLVHQVRSLGAEPVKIREQSPRKNE